MKDITHKDAQDWHEEAWDWIDQEFQVQCLTLEHKQVEALWEQNSILAQSVQATDNHSSPDGYLCAICCPAPDPRLACSLADTCCPVAGPALAWEKVL